VIDPDDLDPADQDLEALFATIPDEEWAKGPILREPISLSVVKNWLELGYGLVPLDRHKKEATRAFGKLSDLPREVGIATVSTWVREGAFAQTPRAGLCIDGLKGTPSLSVMDLDVANMEQVARVRLPVTPLEVTTGREGGGRHFYYLRDPKGAQRGSRTKLTTVGCDYKGFHGYVVCPGSTHKTGLVYRAFWHGVEISPDAITSEMLSSLPILPDVLVQTFIDEDIAAKRASVQAEEDQTDADGFTDLDLSSGSKVLQMRSRGTTASGFDRVEAKDTATFRHGRFQGRTAAQAALELGAGRHCVCCPHEGHTTDENGATTATIHVSTSGSALRTVCFACSRTYAYGDGLGELVQLHAKKRRSTGGLEIETDDNGFNRVTISDAYLDKKGRVDWSKVIGDMGADLRKKRTLVLQAGQGRGKTYAAAGLVRKMTGMKKITVAISPTRSLVADLSTKLELPSYADTEGTIEGSVACCLPSLPRVPSWRLAEDGDVIPLGADLLVVDEIEQGVASLLGTHLSDSRARDAWHALMNHTRAAGARLFLDADAGDGVRELLRQAEIDPGDVVWIIAPGAAQRALEVIKTRTAAWAEILKTAKSGRLAVGVQSLTEAGALGKALPLHDGKPTLVISRETIGEVDLSKINTVLKEYGHLVYTPSLGTGVSIDLENHFQSVWLLVSDGVSTSTAALQMACRVRHPIDSTLRVAKLGPGHKPEAWEADPILVKAKWGRREIQGMKKCGFVREFPEDYADGGEVNPVAERYVVAMATAHSTQVRSGLGRVLEGLVLMVRGLGWAVTEVDDDLDKKIKTKTSKIRSVARDEVAQEDVASVVEAVDLSPEDLKMVSRRGPQSKKETLSLRRAALERAYGAGSASKAEVVAWDDRGRGRRRMRAYAEVVAWSEGGLAREALRRADRLQHEAGVSAPRLTHRAMKAAIKAHLINRVFDPTGGVSQHSSIYRPLDPGSAVTPIEVSPEKARDLSIFLLSPVGAELAGWLGITVKIDSAEKPMEVVSSILKSCGLGLTSRQIRVSGEIKRIYSLDLEALAEVQAMSAHYLGRLRAGLVGSEVEAGEDADADLQQLSVEAQIFGEGIMADIAA
jgi:hypothetical protein